ncbi:hypothetical protein SCAR479_04851 [Seiridium cardinale]|uniref:Uncharacterized protein n=1 Tax=Seiridium cardinale TaxID=138064 RepID=A0ABR2XXS1_9PEZI
MATVPGLIPQLQNLTFAPPTSQNRPIRLGGQDFAHCCLLALNESFEIQNGNLSFRQPSYLSTLTPEDFGSSQFPCGAAYLGNSSGAPEVRVPYDWCANRCDGWQISHKEALSQWIGPLVGFILPCIAFCLNIPRSSKMGIPSMVFRPRPNHTMGLITSVLRFPPALFIVTLDTVIWLSICFAFAGPMLLSGLYEAYLDHRLLTVLDQRVRIDSRNTPKLTVGMRARLLSIILIGNIKMKSSGHVAEIDSLIGGIGPSTPSVHITEVKARLQALLASQTSFGSAVGAPVVFFVGAFIYNLIDIRSKLGDNDTAHALAFGMWWMIVPELAIVSCLLLAANNPGTLHGVLNRPIEQDIDIKKRHFFGLKPLTIFQWQPMEDAYGGRYKTVNLWHRGLNKYKWFRRVIESYLDPSFPQEQREQIQSIDEELRMSFSDWIRSWAGAVFLLLVPCLLAVLTSYHTPRVGFACRSLTHLVYFSTQVPLMTIWLAHTWLEVRVAEQVQSYTSQCHGTERLRKSMKVLLWIVGIILGGGATFSSIGGTLMQLIGVYRNCICKIPAQYWLNKNHPDAYILLTTNTSEEISEALTWWQGTAIAAIAVLCAVCAFGWWHQRRLRALFGDLVELIDESPSIGLRNIGPNQGPHQNI